MVDAIARELLRAGSSEYEVALEASVDNLDDDLLVCEADDQTVFGGVAVDLSGYTHRHQMFPSDVLLVLRLSDQPLAGVVVGLALTPATVLDLETREVRVGLDLLDERHLRTETQSVPERTSSESVHCHPSSLAQISHHQNSLESDWRVCSVYGHDSGRYSP